MTRLLPALLLALAAPTAAAQTAVGVRVLDDDRWCDRVTAVDKHVACEVREFVVEADALDLEALDGPVGVQTWDRPDVLVRARVAGFAHSQDQADRSVRSSRVTVRGGVVRAETPGHVVVSYDVFAPRETDLAVTTVNGPVSVRGLSGRVRARAVNGPVSLSDVAGDVHVGAVNGPVDVRLDGARWRGDGLEVETQNGPVSVTVPRGYSARLEAETQRGRVRTDGLEVCDPVRLRDSQGERLTGRLGDGGPTLRLRTANGPLSVSER